MWRSMRIWTGRSSGRRKRLRQKPINMVRAAALVILFACAASAHDPITTKLTWSREVSRIIYKHCASCHRDGGTAMSLLTYEEARPWAKAIKEEVLERRMPPWGAVKGFGDFKNDQGLTQEQIELITDWVEGGAPGGDPSLLPKLPSSARAPVLKASSELVAGSGFVL